MRTKEAMDLRLAFKALTRTQRRRLRAHAEAGTPILCGRRAYEWCDGKAG